MRRVKPLRIKPKWVIERDFRVSPAINYQTFSNFGPECIKHPREWSMNCGLLNQPTYHPLTGWPTALVEATWNFMTFKQIYLRLSFVPKIWMQAKWHSIRLKVLFKTLCTCPRSCPVCYSLPPRLPTAALPPHSSSIAFEHCLFTSSGRQQPHIDLIAVNCWVIYGTSRLRRLNLLSSPHLWPRSM